MRSRLQSDTPFLTTHAMTPIPRPESAKAAAAAAACQRSSRGAADRDAPQNFVAMEQLVVRLRREVANMKNQVTRAKTANSDLQKELNTATLKITHLTGQYGSLHEVVLPLCGEVDLFGCSCGGRSDTVCVVIQVS